MILILYLGSTWNEAPAITFAGEFGRTVTSTANSVGWKMFVGRWAKEIHQSDDEGIYNVSYLTLYIYMASVILLFCFLLFFLL